MVSLRSGARSRRAGPETRPERGTFPLTVPRHVARAMLIASRTVLRQHREIAAVVATYGVFLGGILILAWTIA